MSAAGFIEAPRGEALGGTAPVPERWVEAQFANSTALPETPQETKSSTAPLAHSEKLADQIWGLFAAARQYDFEDGVETPFSRALVATVRRAGNAAVEIIAYLITYDKVNPEIAAEALRWLGRLKDSSTRQYRLWLLERALQCSSMRIRDGAVLGLASMNDAHAIRYLRRAIAEERCTEFASDLRQVLEQLEQDGATSLAENP